MDWKALVMGMLLAVVLLFSMGARKSTPVESTSESEVGRYELHMDKNVKGQPVWTIFDTMEGEAKVFEQGTVRRVSFKDNIVEDLK